ncbi:MAG: EAL domain-containing protein [Gammaproteobacteria bacterium]|nr:EAL domain-containing protein [Gammaproteobacteria bacterium]
MHLSSDGHHEKPGLNTPAQEGKRKTVFDLNREFSEFLGITHEDLRLLSTCHEALLQGSERFGQLFYDYLFNFSATAGVLTEYQRSGHAVTGLIKKQQAHLVGLLSGDISEGNGQTLIAIGKVHYRYGIEPAWIMGAYRLYLHHLRTLILDSLLVDDASRKPLLDVVSKLLFRDMGLMLEGYWDAAAELLLHERNKVREMQSRVSSLLANIPQVLWSVDVATNQPLYISPHTQKVCAMDIEMPIPCLNWTVPDDRQIVELAWQQALLGKQVEVESRIRAPEGGERWFRRLFRPFLDSAGRVVRIDGVMEDVSDSKEAREHLRRLATTDVLTGLPNRTLWYDRVSQAIAAARREPGRHVVLMILDLNHFKIINDTLGHSTGDEILHLVAQRLKAVLRESDTLARLGGDEFAILLPNAVHGRADAERVAGQVIRCFAEPVHYGDNEFYLGAAIGIALFPDDGEDTDTLVRRADVAMYAAKQSNTGFLFYDAKADTNTAQRLQMSSDLRHALTRGEFELYFQPKVDLVSRRIVGVEALIRWHHPEQGLVPPALFLPVAEQTGLINAISDWVILSAVAQIKHWQRSDRELPVAINLSTRTFQSPKLVERIAEILTAAQVPGRLLEIEITENVLMTDFERGYRLVHELHELGLSIAIDDFGTGYSSLAYLKKLPIDTLKIDKSFVLDMATDENDAAIVRSTIELGHNLGFKVVAEGIEHSHVLEMLTRLGCDFAQGYHISHPLPAPELERWMQESPWGLRGT